MLGTKRSAEDNNQVSSAKRLRVGWPFVTKNNTGWFNKAEVITSLLINLADDINSTLKKDEYRILLRNALEASLINGRTIYKAIQTNLAKEEEKATFAQTKLLNNLNSRLSITSSEHTFCKDATEDAVSADSYITSFDKKNTLLLMKKCLSDIDARINSLFITKVRDGNLKSVRNFLARDNVDLNTVDNNRNTALIHAADKGHVGIVQLLAEQGADINLTNKHGNNAIMQASRNGHFNVVSFLLEQGADSKAANDQGNIPLMFAAAGGYLNIVKRLCGEGSEIDTINESGSTSLMYAAAGGYLDVIKFLISCGANVNAANKFGETTLLKAATEGYLEVVEFLLEQGAFYLIEDAFIKAAYNQHLNIVKLLSKKTNMKLIDKCGSIALIQASEKGHIEVVKLLIEEGVSVDATIEDRSTPLMAAAWEGPLDVVKLLIAKGADLNATNKAGSTPLLLAAGEGHLDVVKFLLENGADINAPDNEMNTPLLEAAAGGHLDVVKFLLENGADVNATNVVGSTPLLLAAKKGHLELVKLLIERSADLGSINIETVDGGVVELLENLAALQGQIVLAKNYCDLLQSITHFREDNPSVEWALVQGFLVGLAQRKCIPESVGNMVTEMITPSSNLNQVSTISTHSVVSFSTDRHSHRCI